MARRIDESSGLPNLEEETPKTIFRCTEAGVSRVYRTSSGEASVPLGLLDLDIEEENPAVPDGPYPHADLEEEAWRKEKGISRKNNYRMRK